MEDVWVSLQEVRYFDLRRLPRASWWMRSRNVAWARIERKIPWLTDNVGMTTDKVDVLASTECLEGIVVERVSSIQ
jgi:hypothetical protein